MKDGPVGLYQNETLALSEVRDMRRPGLGWARIFEVHVRDSGLTAHNQVTLSPQQACLHQRQRLRCVVLPSDAGCGVTGGGKLSAPL